MRIVTVATIRISLRIRNTPGVDPATKEFEQLVDEPEDNGDEAECVTRTSESHASFDEGDATRNETANRDECRGGEKKHETSLKFHGNNEFSNSKHEPDSLKVSRA